MEASDWSTRQEGERERERPCPFAVANCCVILLRQLPFPLTLNLEGRRERWGWFELSEFHFDDQGGGLGLGLASLTRYISPMANKSLWRSSEDTAGSHLLYNMKHFPTKYNNLKLNNIFKRDRAVPVQPETRFSLPPSPLLLNQSPHHQAQFIWSS